MVVLAEGGSGVGSFALRRKVAQLKGQRVNELIEVTYVAPIQLMTVDLNNERVISALLARSTVE